MSTITKVVRVDRQVTRVIRVADQVTQVTRAPTPLVRVLANTPAGPRGARGFPGGMSFHFEQPADDPLSVWTIHHGFNAFPTAVLRDDNGHLMIARYDNLDANTVVVSFPSPQSGTAELIF